MLLALILGIPLLTAAISPFMWRWLGRAWPLLASAGAGLVVVALLLLLPAAIAGQPQQLVVPWLPQLGLEVALRGDGFALVMALIIAGIGCGIFSYAGGYLGKDPRTGSIVAWLALFMAAMLGVALADNIMLLFVAWELTSVSSFMLIGTNHRDADSRAGARRALLVTATGGLALLGGLVLLGQAAGTWRLSELPPLHDHPWAIGAFVCILLGAGTKSAQFPFSFWLPGAMAAPTPVSAYLHSATMVKAGVFLLARMQPVLGGLPAWTPTLLAISSATMLLVILAVPRARDLKALLAYSTIGALALLVGLIGIGSDKAMTAMVVFLIAHACYKGPLFLVAGAIDHAVHSRDIGRLGGLARAMPVTTVTGLLAGASMIGLAPWLGFVAKEYALDAAGYQGWWLMGLISLLAVAFVQVAASVVLIPCFGARRELAAQAHEAPWSMRLPMLTIAVLGLVFGLGLGPFEAWLVAPALAALQAEPYPLALWHGVNAAFLLSLAALGLGALAFWGRARLARLVPELPAGGPLFDRLWYGLIDGGRALTRLIQNGSLTAYVGTTVLVTSLLLLIAWVVSAAPLTPLVRRPVPLIDVIIAVLIAVSALVTALARRRLPAIAALGAVGMGVTLFFLVSLAPDLALTQFLVEILSVVLLVVAFRHLPDYRAEPLGGQLGRALIAALVGLTMCVLTLVALSTDYAESISRWHGEQALAAGKGRNVVNVILVDFRALDTLGEITVLGIAALGVAVLVGTRRRRPAAAEDAQ